MSRVTWRGRRAPGTVEARLTRVARPDWALSDEVDEDWPRCRRVESGCEVKDWAAGRKGRTVKA